MIALAIATSLIVQTYGGSMSVVEGLSDQACAEASCVALRGQTCEEADASDKARAARWEQQQEEWKKLNPKKAAACDTVERSGSWLYGCRWDEGLAMSSDLDLGKPKLARCVK